MEGSTNENKRPAEELPMTEAPSEKKVRRCVKKLDCALEKEVGIDSYGFIHVVSGRYVSKEKGILGVLKDSCDDFIVQEVDEEGKVVELIDTSEPQGRFFPLFLMFSASSPNRNNE